MLYYFLLSLSKKLNDYIVILNIPDDKASHAEAYTAGLSKARRYLSKEEKITHQFFNGFVANLSNGTREKLENDSSVKLVEEDQEVNVAEYAEGDLLLEKYYYEAEKSSAFLSVQNEAPWGISRISSGKYFDDQGTYVYPSNGGQGVNVYVIDTGIEIDHPEFNGSAVWGANFVKDTPDTDEMGHGTHVAGTIGGRNSGIAKKAKLIAVKVLDKYGMGRISRVIFGIDYVIKEHFKKLDELYDRNKKKFAEKDYEEAEYTIKGERMENNFLEDLTDFLKLEEIKPKTVVNMSVGGMKSQALEFAVDYGTAQGIHFSVAAGNNHQDACYFSPGSSKHAVTVGASTRDDTVAFFSNIGNCVDLFAPGHEIKSSWINKKKNVISGTSMAAPHVAGIMALYLGFQNLTPGKLKDKLIEDSYNVIEDEDDEDSDMLDFWPIKYLFGKQSKPHPLASIKHLNDKIEHYRGKNE